MTVDSISSRVIYHGNASATVFPVPFQYSQSESIRVVFTDASGTSTELASGAFGISSTTSGTSITYPLSGSPIASGTRLTIFRDTDQSQIVALKFGGAFNPEVLEYDVFDRTVMMVQEIQDEVDRSVKVAVDSEMTQEELQDKIFTASDNAVNSASSAASSANSAANSAATATTEANRSKIEADRSQGEADRASEIAAGTFYKTTFVNKRASWAVTTAMASGATLTLPETYFPTRNHLMLFYNGVLCELRSASTDAEYQYSEIGTIDVLSSTVTIHFAVNVGDRFDMIAVASGIVDVDALPLIPITAGGTGATTAAQARTNLGAVAKTGDTMTGNLLPSTASSLNLGSTSYRWNIYSNSANSTSANITTANITTANITNLSVSGTVSGINAAATFVGDIRFIPFRMGQLPTGWYICNGGGYSLTSPQGIALANLTYTLRLDWYIGNVGNIIYLPNMFYSDGRGYFMRAADQINIQGVGPHWEGVTYGGVQGDAIRNITGYAYGPRWNSGTDRYGAFYNGGRSSGQYGTGSDYSGLSLDFDASRVVPVAGENRPLNIGMSPAIYLGV